MDMAVFILVAKLLTNVPLNAGMDIKVMHM